MEILPNDGPLEELDPLVHPVLVVVGVVVRVVRRRVAAAAAVFRADVRAVAELGEIGVELDLRDVRDITLCLVDPVACGGFD